MKLNTLLCDMENDYLKAIASMVLPVQLLDYFTVVGLVQTDTEIHIGLDELMDKNLSEDLHFESKGFMEPVSVTDFPIRDHKVVLKIRRRHRTDTRTSKSFSLPIDLDIVAKGTRYSKEFGAFKKRRMESISIIISKSNNRFARNCLCAHVTCCSSRQRNGLTGKSCGLSYYLRNILI